LEAGCAAALAAISEGPRAGGTTSHDIEIHELRHSAADNLWRETGNLLLAQQLLRHESVATTQQYLRPTRDDLDDALAPLHAVRSEEAGNGQ
jgi:site-specific recombinase XerD